MKTHIRFASILLLSTLLKIGSTTCFAGESFDNIRNLNNDMFSAFQSHLEDEVLRSRLMSAELDLQSLEVNLDVDPKSKVFERKVINKKAPLKAGPDFDKTEYISSLLQIVFNIRKGVKVLTVKDLKADQDGFGALYETALDLGKSHKELKDFCKEFYHDENQVVTFSLFGSGMDSHVRIGFGLILAKGVIFFNNKSLITFDDFSLEFNKDPNAFNGYTPGSFIEMATMWRAVKNLSIVLKRVGPPLNPPPDAERFLNYAGVSIGMDEEKCINTLRESLDYSKYNALRSIEIRDAAAFNSPEANECRKFVGDLRVCAGGYLESSISLSPPFKMRLVTHKVTAKGADRPPFDVFIFQGGKLVSVGRYPDMNVTAWNQSGFKYPSVGNDQQSARDGSVLKALIEKYGQPQLTNAVVSSGFKTFQTVWTSSQPYQLGAIHYPNRVRLKADIAQATIKDDPAVVTTTKREQLAKQNLENNFGQNHGLIVPMNLDELQYPPQNKADSLPSLRCVYYWSRETSELMKSKAVGFLKSENAGKKQSEEKAVDKAKANF